MYIQHDALVDAIHLVNRVADCSTRKIELALIQRMDSRPPVPPVAVEKIIPFDGPKRFWADVERVKQLLERDGTYYRDRQFFRDPRKITDELVSSGYSWVNIRHVKEAQRLVQEKIKPKTVNQ